MRDHLADRTPVGDDKAAEAPATFEDLALQVLAAAGRDAVQIVEGIHEGRGTRVERCLERRQIGFPEHPLAHVDRVVIAAGDRSAIGGEMLDRGHHRIGVAELAPLESLHTGIGDFRPQPAVLASAFHHPAPARIAGDVDHRRECPVDAAGGSFGGGNSRRTLDRFEVKAGGFGQRNREGGLVAMDHVLAEQQRDLQARLHRNLLVGPGRIGAQHIQHRADLATPDALFMVALESHRAGGSPVARILGQLADLFLDRHLLQQALDLVLQGLCFGAQGQGQEQGCSAMTCPF